MAAHSDEMTRCLATCDVAGIRRLWKHISPHLPQPTSDREALATIHYARTINHTFAFKLRAYSHAWLLGEGLPSGLPDELKPKAERMFPCVVEAVGIAVGGASELGRAIAPLVRGAMSDAVLDVYADSKNRSPNVSVVKARMAEARTATVKRLLGKI